MPVCRPLALAAVLAAGGAWGGVQADERPPQASSAPRAQGAKEARPRARTGGPRSREKAAPGPKAPAPVEVPPAKGAAPKPAPSSGAAGNANGAPPAPEPAADAPTSDVAPEAEATSVPVHTLLRESDFDFAACRLELARLGAVYSVEPSVAGPERDCGVDRPLKVEAPIRGVQIEGGGAIMRCDTARHLAWWLRDFAQPAARYLPGAPRIVALAPGSTTECRQTRGASTVNLSEHALGNAFDVAAFVLDDGTRIDVAEAEEGRPVAGFLAALRWSACAVFDTVLGPGSNSAHADHLHVDIKARRGGYRICE